MSISYDMLRRMLLCYKHEPEGEAQGLSTYNINNIPTGRVIGDI